MTEHHFTIRHGTFKAELALGGVWSLYELAEFIIKTVGFDFDHCFEFCDNLKNPYKSKERYTLFADIGEEADDPGVKTTLVSAVFHPKKRMLFHFDYGDDWYFLVTCTAVKDSTAKRHFKKVLSTSGTPPEQYPSFDEWALGVLALCGTPNPFESEGESYAKPSLTAKPLPSQNCSPSEKLHDSAD